MSSLHAFAVALRRDDVLHFLGYPVGRRPAPGIEQLLDAAIEEARGLSAPRAAWRRLPIEAAPAVELDPVPAEGLVVGLVTAGRAIEDRAAERLAGGDATGALLLDAAGSAAVEEAADRASAAIVAELGGGDPDSALLADDRAGGGGHVSCRISPGYGRWRLSAQRALFGWLPHRELGIELGESLLMTPRKSVSFAMWVGADARPLSGLSGCARCELETCRYRREPRA